MILTAKQTTVLRFIEDFVRRNQRSPTFREIGQGVGVHSTNTVAHYIRILEEKGAIERASGGLRTIRLIQPAPSDYSLPQ
jgi:repressor LexA